VEALAIMLWMAGERRALPMLPAVYSELYSAREGGEMADKLA
jgi:hypothetical protein